jgi:DNA-binding transcriptional LysR family regulator
MDVRQLRILRELGELGSVRAVADALHITPSAVSQQLRRLQLPIQVPLTRKNGRVLALTEAGQALAAAGAEVEAAMARAHEVARDIAMSPQGQVTLAAFNSAAMAFFPGLARAFPQGGAVSVSLADGDVAQAEFPALTSRYDVVVAHRFPHTPAWPRTVRAIHLLTEPLDIALPADHRLARYRTITAARAAGEPWISTHAGFPVGAIIDALATVAGRPETVAQRVNEFTVVAELVKAHGALALMPRWTIPTPPGVVLRPLDGVRSTRRIDALVRPENTVRPAVRSVLDVLVGVARQVETGTHLAGPRTD